MRKSTSLIFLTILTILAIKPEPAKFGLNLLLPSVFRSRSRLLLFCRGRRCLCCCCRRCSGGWCWLSSCFGCILGRWWGLCCHLYGGLFANDKGVAAINGRIETTNFRSHVTLKWLKVGIVAVLRADCGAVCYGARCIINVIGLLANFTQREHWHLLFRL